MFYGNQRQLEYDYLIAPGSDPGLINVRFTGAKRITVDKNGDLILSTSVGEIRQAKPRVFQEIAGQRVEVSGRFILRSKNQVGFEVGHYDRNLPLTIDPVLVYSTFLGASHGDDGKGIAVDAAGNTYVMGTTNSLDFPTTPGAFITPRPT